MRIHILALILLAIVVAFLVNSVTDEEVEEMGDSNGEQRFDYYMNDVESTHFSAEGRREHRILAERFTHYPNPEFTLLEAPNLTFYPERDLPWTVTAERGRINEDEELEEGRIELSDNVIISHTDSEGQSVTIYTDFLLIYPDSRRLLTDRDVRMESVNYQLSSTGMSADLNSRRLQFLNNVRGRYE